MQFTQRKDAFVKLGEALTKFVNGDHSESYTQQIDDAARRAEAQNPWFTQDNIKKALSALSQMLLPAKLNNWTARYPKLAAQKEAKTVGVIMAGNIPFVGFHDMLCVLLSGNAILAKLSSKDEVLPKATIKVLLEIEPEFKSYIRTEANFRSGFDAIIATGSDNSSRYFEQYFGKYPHIIRANRNSIAILRGDETQEELQLLGKDIFSYFGLGCRNVSKLYIPNGFDLMRLFDAFSPFEKLAQHTKYVNNFDYQRAIFLMNKIEFEANGFVIVREQESMTSPISVLHYQRYHDLKNVHARIESEKEQIQCVVGKNDMHPEAIAFGQSQSPQLWDYADNVDTMEFLLNLG